MRVQDLVDQLGELGFTRNEALAWITLVEDGGAGLTGYEVAARSGIPRSAVYAVLRKLEGAGAAFAVSEEPARYVAVDPERLVEQLRRGALTRLDQLAEGLRSLPTRARPEPIFLLTRYEEVMDCVASMVRGAETSVYLSLWPRELDLLRPALAAVAERPLHRVLHSPGEVAEGPPGFSCWSDAAERDPARARWSHKAVVVVDRREALIGGTEPGADNHAVRTSNPSLVDLATNHIILDITLMAGRQGLDPQDVVAPMMRPHLDGRPR